MDVYDRLQIDDLRQAAVIVATFVYNTAMRDQMFPRKPIEPPLPKESGNRRKMKTKRRRRSAIEAFWFEAGLQSRAVVRHVL